jgi:hypothetical protein
MSKKTCVVQTRLSRFDKARLAALAEAEARTLSDWIENRITIEYERLRARHPGKYPERPEV